jgi:hypothetical protein
MALSIQKPKCEEKYFTKVSNYSRKSIKATLCVLGANILSN